MFLIFIKKDILQSMKHTIHLKESDLKRIISESVRRTLNEMGTIKQNALLRKLTGTDKYDNLSVSDSSKMIDDLLKKQPKRLASEKQINFLLKRGVNWVKDVELTSEDASFMISGLMRGNTSKVNVIKRKYNLQDTVNNNNFPILIDNDLEFKLETNKQFGPSNEQEESVLNIIDKNIISQKIEFHHASFDHVHDYFILSNNIQIPSEKLLTAKVITTSRFGEINLHTYNVFIYIDKHNNKWYHTNKENLFDFLQKLNLL